MSDPAISETEWDLLDALWAVEGATAREVADALAERRGWAYSTVKTMLDRMVKKGLVNARQVGNVWEYTPAVEPRPGAPRGDDSSTPRSGARRRPRSSSSPTTPA